MPLSPSLYIQAGRLPEGLQKLNEVIEKNPTNAGAYSTRGMVLEDSGEDRRCQDQLSSRPRA